MSADSLLLVDGSNYLYRAFYALPNLRNSYGFPIGAIKIMIHMMRRIRLHYPTTHVACIFDTPGQTFRKDLYPKYKMHRSPMPKDLVAQLDIIYDVVRALGWSIFLIPNTEADDVIGTLAIQSQKLGWKTTIATSDKDFAQLVNSNITLINTMRSEYLNVNGVLKKFGVFPEQIVDYLSITGDLADNIPGVYQAGPKTAVKWIKKYGSLSQLIAHADEIDGLSGKNLRSALNWFPIAKQLLTIKTDIDLSSCIQHLEQLKSLPENKENLHYFFLKFELHLF